MQRSFRKVALVLGTGLMMIPLAAADCLGPVDGDAGPQECQLDTDCPGQQQCHPTLLVCEDECTGDVDCSGDRPVCNTQGGDGGPYILEVDGIRDLCICDETSCADGEECSAETGTCVPAGSTTCDPANNGDECPAEQPFCEQGVCVAGCDSTDELRLECGDDEVCNEETGECEAAACSPVGAENPDNADEVCTPDGTYQPYCEDDVCLDDNLLCQLDEASADFNQCEDPDVITATCPAAEEFGARDASGPVIYDADFERDADFDEDCPQAGTTAYTASFLYWDADSDAYSGESGTYNAFQWAREDQAPTVATLPIAFDDADDTSGLAFMVICFQNPPETIAVQIEDQAGNVSNAACATR